MSEKSILVIDDDNDILNVVTIILANRGYSVLTDTTGSYVEHMKEPYPSLVILDVSLNGKDGREVCRKLKAAAPTASIPVMLFSANLHLDDISKECEADDYLAKPFEMSTLVKKVDRLMRHE